MNTKLTNPHEEAKFVIKNPCKLIVEVLKYMVVVAIPRETVNIDWYLLSLLNPVTNLIKLIL
jgi:hypothetical protein